MTIALYTSLFSPYFSGKQPINHHIAGSFSPETIYIINQQLPSEGQSAKKKIKAGQYFSVERKGSGKFLVQIGLKGKGPTLTVMFDPKTRDYEGSILTHSNSKNTNRLTGKVIGTDQQYQIEQQIQFFR